MAKAVSCLSDVVRNKRDYTLLTIRPTLTGSDTMQCAKFPRSPIFRIVWLSLLFLVQS